MGNGKKVKKLNDCHLQKIKQEKAEIGFDKPVKIGYICIQA